MKEKKGIFFRSVFSFLAIILVLCLNITVSAEMFSAGEFSGVVEGFETGETVMVPEQTEVDVFGTDSESEYISEENGISSEEQVNPPLADENVNYSEELINDVLFSDISVEMDGTATSPGNGQAITLIFKNQADGVYTQLQMRVNIGETIILPNVPERENALGSGWKVDLNVADSVAKIWESGTSLTVSSTDTYYGNKIVNNVLTFYAVPGIDPCVVTYYAGNGSKVLQQTEVKKGTTITFPDFAESGYKSLGWATAVNAAVAKYQIGGTYQINSDTDFYLVRTQMVTAAFKSRKGAENALYRSYNQTVEKGTTIILPAVPEVKGYQILGWATQSYATTAEYAVGQTLILNENTTFYAAYKYVGKRTISFTNNNGTSKNKKYTSLNKTVSRWSYYTLPELPKFTGYKAVGWTTVKNGTTVKYRPGDIIKVSKNITFYAIYQRTCKVYLRTKGGTLWKTVEVKKGAYYELPGVRNKNGYTMMGWSNKKGQSKNAKYEVGERIKVTKNMTLYSVLYVRSKETDYSGIELQNLAKNLTSKYKQVIFVGDSRTVRMELTLKNSGYSAETNKISFIAENGKGLSWLKSTGYSQLLTKVGTKKSINDKPTAVIFNLGVNDLENISAYVTYMKSIAPELKKRGCTLYYMSVNPVNNVSIAYYAKKDRPESKLRSFNTTIKSKLCGKSGDYTYIDTYSYLLKYGYGTNAGKEGYDVEKDDGLHYTVKTYKRIFRYCINILKK